MPLSVTEWHLIGECGLTLVSAENFEAQNFFEHPVNKGCEVFSDVPHLFKCIRNRLLRSSAFSVFGQWVKGVSVRSCV